MTRSFSVVNLLTPSPDLDATFLQDIFPNNETVLEKVEQTRILTLFSETTLILLPANQPSRTLCVVKSVSFLDQVLGEHVFQREMCGVAVHEIRLPGGGVLLLIPPQLATSSNGRRALALCLVAGETEIEDSPYHNSYQDMELAPSTAADSQQRSPINNGGETKLPMFPSLQVKLLEKEGQWRSNFPLNSRVPIPVETDLFKGQILMLLRPPNPQNDDPYWNERVFSKKKRRVVIQIQGKFKYEPKGVVYAGGEISKPMKLGLVTRGLCTILLRLVESFNSNVHYSFGDPEEKAHIVVPAWTFFERIVATPPGETPPPIEEFFVESPESIALRKDSQSFGQWNTTDTYSLSFYTMYMDLTTWKLVSLPISGDICLSTFWKQSLLRICMYEKELDGQEKRHLHKMNKYALAVELKYLGSGVFAQDNLEEEEEDTESDVMQWSGNRPKPFVRQEIKRYDEGLVRSESAIFQTIQEDEENDDQYFFDAEEINDEVTDHGTERDKKYVELELLKSIDNACPCWIEVCTNRNGYSRAYAIVIDGILSLRPAQACEDLVQHSKWVNTTIDDSFSSRLSTNERTRRMLGLVLSSRDETDVPLQNIQSLLDQQSIYSNLFLNRSEPTIPEQERLMIHASSFVARAISDRHWIEEWAKITARGISFYYPERRRPHFRVHFASVTSVVKLLPEECPSIPNHFFLAVHTIGRTVYLMFASEIKRDEWLYVIRENLENPSRTDRDSNSPENIESTIMPVMDNPAEEFMHKSSMWNCKNRRILNCARFSLNSQSAGTKDPLELVETALRRGLKITDDFAHDLDQRREFLVSAAELKDACVQNLPEDGKMVFFLNLYHVLIIHAYLVLGLPDSSLKFISYYNNIAYQVDDDIFSLAELEHSILRANMSYPSQFLSRLVIPKSRYRMALSHADYRLNFALNCGSKSNPQGIFIYKKDQLQSQLDAASRMYLLKASVVQKSAREVLVYLPRVCQWYNNDFGGSDEAILKRIEVYLPSSARRALSSCWISSERRFDMKCVSMRFLSYQFDCRPLTLSNGAPDDNEARAP